MLVATLKVRLVKRQRQHSILPLNLEELKEAKAVQFAAEVTNTLTAVEAAHYEVNPENLGKGTKTVLLEVAGETIGCVKSQKKWISDETFAAIREKREGKGKDKNQYKERKAEVQRKLRVDKQQQLEGMGAKVKALNSKRKFQAALSDSQINDWKVPATSAMYPVSDWRKID